MKHGDACRIAVSARVQTCQDVAVHQAAFRGNGWLENNSSRSSPNQGLSSSGSSTCGAFIEAVPKSASGKILRRELKAKAKA